MTALETPAGLTARLLIAMVTGYRRLLSPLLPPRCRFAPSCSSYAVTALQRHGALRGGWLSVRRVARCHPFHSGGHDPVPPARLPARDDACAAQAAKAHADAGGIVGSVDTWAVPASVPPDPRPSTRRSGATRA